MVCTDSTSVRTCVFLFMHAHSLPLAGLFDGPFYPAVPFQERDASAILQDIAKARQNIQQSLVGVSTAPKKGKKSHYWSIVNLYCTLLVNHI